MNNQIIELDARISVQIGDLEQFARHLVVSDSYTRSEAIDAIKKVKIRRADVVEFWKDMKAKAHAAWKGVVSNEKRYTDILDNVERLIKSQVLKHDRLQEQIRQAEQYRLQAIADRKAEQDRQRLLKEAEKLKTPELKEERLEAAAAVAAPVVEVAPVVERQKGEVTKKIWKARIVNPKEVPFPDWWKIDEKALDGFAKATKGAKPVPGVEFYEESQLSISTK